MQHKLKLPSALVIQSYDFLCSLFISRYPRGQFWPHLSVWEWVVALGDSTFGLWQCSYPKRPLYGIYKHTSSVSHAPPLSLSLILSYLSSWSLHFSPSLSFPQSPSILSFTAWLAGFYAPYSQQAIGIWVRTHSCSGSRASVGPTLRLILDFHRL